MIKRFILLTAAATFIFNCAHQLTRNYEVPSLVNQGNECNPRIVKKKNLIGLGAEYLGEIKLDDSGFSASCSEEKAIEILKKEACLLNSNLINITEEIYPRISSCYRCVAEFYRVDHNNVTNKILSNTKRIKLGYNTKNKLIWEDFRNTLPDTSSVPFEFISNIEIKGGGMRFWSGGYEVFGVEGVFYCDVSGVKSSFISDKNLPHVQVLYDLSQIYALKLEQFLNSDDSHGGRVEKIINIYKKYYNELIDVQGRYIIETDYGTNESVQDTWINMVTQDLVNLQAIKDE